MNRKLILVSVVGEGVLQGGEVDLLVENSRGFEGRGGEIDDTYAGRSIDQSQ